MSLYLLDLMESVRDRLDDFGGNTGAAPVGYYAYWQYNDSPCLWKNAEIIRYLQRALRDIAVRAPVQEEGIAADILGELCRLSVTANNPEVVIPSHVLTVEQVRLVSSEQILQKTTSARLSAELGSSGWTTTTGTPSQYIEPRAGYLRLFPIPLSSDEIRLIVRRGFLTDFAWSDVQGDDSAALYELVGVPDELEEAIVCATCRYAYLKNDADAQNIPLSQEYERQLTALVGPPVSQRQRDARRANANLSMAIRGHRYSGSRRGRLEDSEEWE